MYGVLFIFCVNGGRLTSRLYANSRLMTSGDKKPALLAGFVFQLGPSELQRNSFALKTARRRIQIRPQETIQSNINAFP